MKHPIENDCPKCGAIAGQKCQGKRGDRKAFHKERGRRLNYAPPREVERDLSDSPIEHVLLSALMEWIEHEGREDVEVETQAVIGPYRADILLTTNERSLVIEADGSAYHESTEAIQHDKRRDRYCAIQGHAVMRFTGKEILRDARGCAAEIGAWVRSGS